MFSLRKYGFPFHVLTVYSFLRFFPPFRWKELPAYYESIVLKWGAINIDFVSFHRELNVKISKRRKLHDSQCWRF